MSIVVVDVRHRVWGDGRIRVDGTRSKVLRDTGGWYEVEGLHPGEAARVLYRDLQDLLLICRSTSTLRVAFRAGEGLFEWEGRAYHISSMIEGEVRIDQEGRSVVRGRATVSGLHLEHVAAELAPIVRPLAWGLTLRSEHMGRDRRFDPQVATGP